MTTWSVSPAGAYPTLTWPESVPMLPFRIMGRPDYQIPFIMATRGVSQSEAARIWRGR